MPRELKTKLPSPSEHGMFVHCPTAWWWKYREGIRRTGSAARLVSGDAVSWALSEFYIPKGIASGALEVYDTMMQAAMVGITGTMDEEAWVGQIALDRGALEYYITHNPPMEDEWEKVIEAQGRIEDGVNLVPDMVVLLRDGFLRVEEWKLLSPFADIETEKKKYEMDMQPLSYSKMVEVKFGKPCASTEMRFLIRPKPAKGRYLAAPATADKHIIYIEPWKKRMWEGSANFANAGMEYVDWLASKGEIPIEEIPKFTHNCIKKLGSMTIFCDYYPACSENVHPLGVKGMFEGKGHEIKTDDPGKSEGKVL
jgi:hypothetical protein